MAYGHDDVNLRLLISNKIQFLNQFLQLSYKITQNFKNSLVLELYWENKIDYDYIDNNITKKISLITLLRKFFSKKIRTILR